MSSERVSFAPRPNKNERKNLASLLVCSLSVLSICLAGFNVYLFIWLCSTLNSSQLMPSSSLNPLGKLELFQVTDETIKFNGRILAKKALNVGQVRQKHFMSSESILRLASSDRITFNAANQSSSFSISSKRNSLEFPSGLLVFGRSNNSPNIDCATVQTNRNTTTKADNQTEAVCWLRARRFKIKNPTGLDFSNLKSIQTNRVRTKRLHSSLQKLQLMTSFGANFRSADDEIQLQALDLVSIGRRHSPKSTVMIKAKSINLGTIAEQKRPQLDARILSHSGVEGGFKLCICLLQRQKGQREEDVETNDWPNNGLVFAVQAELRCSKFNGRFCNASNKRNINN